MLEFKKKITINGKSTIDGVEVCGYQAQIDSSNPADIVLTDWQVDKEMYKANRAACRADQAEFEDYAYTVQDAMIAEAEANTEATE